MANKTRTVEHKSFTGPDYKAVLHSLEVYLNKYPTLELVSVQETNVNMRLVTKNTYEHFATYFIVWSSWAVWSAESTVKLPFIGS